MPANAPRMHHHDNHHAQAQALALAVANQLDQAVNAQGGAGLAVSGGRSPVAFFQHLRRQALPWSQVQIVLVDERCVAHNHPDRNAALVREHLLQDAAAAATFIDWLNPIVQPEACSPEVLVQQANTQFQQLLWPLTVAVLGLGADGHTASWFPNSPGLDKALHGTEPLAWVRPLQAPHLRLTLSLAAISACPHQHLALAGASKQAVLAAAQAGTTPDKPIQTLLAHAPDLHIWSADISQP